MLKKKYFGTDGIRGEVGRTNINSAFMLKLGWAAGTVFARSGHSVVLIGKDTRVSGYMLESALQAGFLSAGIDILLLGPMPTPAIAYLTQSTRAHAGVVISASHNSYQDNGIKFFDHQGYKLADELECAIEGLIDSEMHTVESGKIGKASRMVDAGGRYIEFCKSTFPSHLSLHGIKLVLDCANGATYSVGPKIFHELGAEVTSIADNPDGFNINELCGATDTAALEKAVRDLNADVGIAFDGDGDRVIMIDEDGDIVNGDELLCIIALDAQRCGRNSLGVIGTVMSNLGLEKSLRSAGIPFDRAPVGDRNILQKLKKNGWYLGGESSGHIVDLNITTTGDGIITALQVLRVMVDTRESLVSLKKRMKKRPQVLVNVPADYGINVIDLPDVRNKVLEVENRFKGDGRVLLRSSGTEPMIRVMVEGNDEQEVHNAAYELADLIKLFVLNETPRRMQ